jgi:hypothetical protein
MSKNHQKILIRALAPRCWHNPATQRELLCMSLCHYSAWLLVKPSVCWPIFLRAEWNLETSSHGSVQSPSDFVVGRHKGRTLTKSSEFGAFEPDPMQESSPKKQALDTLLLLLLKHRLEHWRRWGGSTVAESHQADLQEWFLTKKIRILWLPTKQLSCWMWDECQSYLRHLL